MDKKKITIIGASAPISLLHTSDAHEDFNPVRDYEKAAEMQVSQEATDHAHILTGLNRYEPVPPSGKQKRRDRRKRDRKLRKHGK